jgi:hypothetical protein
MGAVYESATVPYQLSSLRISRIIIKIDRVIILSVDCELAKSSVGFLLS